LVSKKDISFCFRLISLIQSDFLSFNETIVLSLRLLVFLNSLRKTSHQGTAGGPAVSNHAEQCRIMKGVGEEEEEPCQDLKDLIQTRMVKYARTVPNLLN
jgi:hypothetical protein